MTGRIGRNGELNNLFSGSHVKLYQNVSFNENGESNRFKKSVLKFFEAGLQSTSVHEQMSKCTLLIHA